jgi:methylated-DNA-[protein]-cysteine S-methyltransferase
MNGERREFDLPLGLYGTAFQVRVWRQVLAVPYGQAATYQEIADAIGNPKAVRAVGGANGRNPLPLIVPCHRIIGRNGQLVGYGGGLWRKEWLLRHEGYLLL